MAEVREIKPGIPIFSILDRGKVVRTYEKEVECQRNLEHGKFKALINVYEDGTEQSENNCPECEKEWERFEKEQQETKDTTKQCWKQKIRNYNL